MKTAPIIVLANDERRTLTTWSRGRSTPARLVLRAKIVLAAAEGKTNEAIAAELHTSKPTVGRWRSRFAAGRTAGIEKDASRPGRTPAITAETVTRIVRKTTQEKPEAATHWSTRSMAKAVGVSKATVQRIWAAHGLKPHLTRNFKLSNDPHFVEKLVDVVGLYLNPPEHALVLCADEKTSIQALDRTQRGLPIHRGRCGTMTPRLQTQRHDDLVRRDRDDGGQIDRNVHVATPASGVDQVPETDRRRNPGGVGFALDRGQLRHAQASQSPIVAETASAISHPFHSHQQFLVESGRALVP